MSENKLFAIFLICLAVVLCSLLGCKAFTDYAKFKFEAQQKIECNCECKCKNKDL